MEHLELIAGKKHAPARLGRVLVLGLGKSGCAAVEYLSSLVGTRVEKLSIAGGTESEQARAFADRIMRQSAERGCAQAIEVSFGQETFDESYDLCIASPGISQFSDFYVNAQRACAEVVSEVEFAWRESDVGSTWIAVTGTNGKTTTTALTSHVLQSCGFDARAVGNIGDVALNAVAAPHPPSVYVVEVSSFQLAGTRLFAPDASIILSITPDHLSWHNGYENYVAAKFKAIENLGATGGPAIFDVTDGLLREKMAELDAIPLESRGFPLVPLAPLDLSSDAGEIGPWMDSLACGAWVDQGDLRVDFGGARNILCAARELKIKGSHNVSNALAAASAALAVGAPAERVARALATFEPLAHRIEPCGAVRGIECFNDSKATNVDSVLKALEAFRPGTVVLLLGGRDKGTDLSPLVESAAKRAKAVVCFGEARGRFLEAFATAAPGLEAIEAGTMESALDAGLSQAQPGDAVLLSPACASFDEFSCYQERGDVFKGLVAQRAAANGSAQR